MRVFKLFKPNSRQYVLCLFSFVSTEFAYKICIDDVHSVLLMHFGVFRTAFVCICNFIDVVVVIFAHSVLNNCVGLVSVNVCDLSQCVHFECQCVI